VDDDEEIIDRFEGRNLYERYWYL